MKNQVHWVFPVAWYPFPLLPVMQNTVPVLDTPAVVKAIG